MKNNTVISTRLCGSPAAIIIVSLILLLRVQPVSLATDFQILKPGVKNEWKSGIIAVARENHWTVSLLDTGSIRFIKNGVPYTITVALDKSAPKVALLLLLTDFPEDPIYNDELDDFPGEVKSALDKAKFPGFDMTAYKDWKQDSGLRCWETHLITTFSDSKSLAKTFPGYVNRLDEAIGLAVDMLKKRRAEGSEWRAGVIAAIKENHWIPAHGISATMTTFTKNGVEYVAIIGTDKEHPNIARLAIATDFPKDPIDASEISVFPGEVKSALNSRFPDFTMRPKEGWKPSDGVKCWQAVLISNCTDSGTVAGALPGYVNSLDEAIGAAVGMLEKRRQK